MRVLFGYFCWVIEMKNDKQTDWINKLIEELDKSSSSVLETEIILDEIITKLNNLISEINNYIAEIHYGLKITNEKINVSISELDELEKKLKEYLDFVESMKESFENTYNAIIAIKNEMKDIKHSLEESSLKMNNRHSIMEDTIRNHTKKIESLSNSVKSLSKTQETIINSLNSTKILLYITIALTVVNIIISLKTFGIIS